MAHLPTVAALPVGRASGLPGISGDLILVSNRGPVEYTISPSGALEAGRGSGGVVTALSAVATNAAVTWIACPMGPGDRLAGLTALDTPHSIRQNPAVRFAGVPQEAYDRYYRIFANSILWSLQHHLWDTGNNPNINSGIYDAWENGYVTVNRLVADAVAEVAARGLKPVVLLQNYHLYLVAGHLPKLSPHAMLQHFIHIPWPESRYWSLLPATFRTPILRSLCDTDIVGFQTHRDAHNFLYTCEYLLADTRVNYRLGTVRTAKRTTYAREYPISIDVEGVRATANSPEATRYLDKLTPLKGQQTILRVDRLEPSKNIIRGFRAFDTLLGRYPDLAGKVRFWAFLVPSRTELSSYRNYRDEVFALVAEINARHGHDAWKPIEVFHENNYVQAIAAMTQYDVLMVNSVIDGMNLVAKEGVTVNQRDGVLILSETAGAFEELGRYALAVAATDIEGMVQTLHAALIMSRRERSRRARQLRRAVAQADLSRWVANQLGDISTLAQEGRLKPQRRRLSGPPAPLSI